MDSDEEADMDNELWEEMEMYRRVYYVTAQMFHPAWISVCKLMECGHMFRLRYGTGSNFAFCVVHVIWEQKQRIRCCIHKQAIVSWYDVYLTGCIAGGCKMYKYCTAVCSAGPTAPRPLLLSPLTK